VVACERDPTYIGTTPVPTESGTTTPESGSATPESVDRLEKDHGDKFLLVSLGTNERKIYGLTLNAADPNVSNIKVRYIMNEEFNGKQGPVIKAEISWEVRGKSCRGKEQIFSLEAYVKPKPLTAVCGGTTR
jgi:hypothetical protein